MCVCLCVCVRCVRLYLCVFVCQASGVYRCVWMSKQNFEAELQPELKNFKNFQGIPQIFKDFEGIPKIFKDFLEFHGFLRIVKEFLGCSRIWEEFQGFSSNLRIFYDSQEILSPRCKPACDMKVETVTRSTAKGVRTHAI